MKLIKSEESIKTFENGNYAVYLDGFGQIVEARKNGEFAVWEYGGYIVTTDDVPDNFEQLEQSEITSQLQSKAFARHNMYEEIKNKNAGTEHKARI